MKGKKQKEIVVMCTFCAILKGQRRSIVVVERAIRELDENPNNYAISHAMFSVKMFLCVQHVELMKSLVGQYELWEDCDMLYRLVMDRDSVSARAFEFIRVADSSEV